ncbi:MAG TPA: bifunctional phosphopantothenoylcysteine decarboxylase/phosphopantothenate--cysteine ligase CoaBC [Bacillales bacterium]|nr:bifunctional phosphopantothenoylcysteine decarboxylase/phosphopantothenate--cysteine ligase CoaBC [Bacillales bacterium]
MKGKNILLCVTGGIAAFKAAALTSKLAQKGANVHVLMSENATKFVTPLTFQALSRNAVHTDIFNEIDPTGIAHIDLPDNADLVMVAPATANIIGKLAGGIADDMISTTILATKAPVWIAPAMNVNMYDHPAVQRNLKALAEDGYRLLEPGEGLLACGWIGKGRLAEPEDILDAVERHFAKRDNLPLEGKKVLVTAGPTQEKVDPVRYFTNHSSGKMGYALAEEAAGLGAEVTLVSGPSDLEMPAGVQVIRVVTAAEMYDAVIQRFADVDIVLKAAAVSDYRPKTSYEHKMKKKDGKWMIEMERTKDILAELGNEKDGQVLVGFAAESENIGEYAEQKLRKKNLDFVVANNISEAGSGFRGDTNKVAIFRRDGSKRELEMMSKREAAGAVLDEVRALLEGNQIDDR